MTDQPRTTSVLKAIRPFRWRIAFTYTLTVIEDLLELSYPWATGLAINGLLAHDYGFASDHNENGDGVDLNLEAQFAPLDFPGSPRPHVGVSANFYGDTSAAYAGLSFRFRETARWFVDGLLGAAVHNGPLHKDPVRCNLYSDCGYGVRILPHLGLEAGYRISPVSAVSLFYDHMSHKWIVDGENEGLDHIGLRYLRSY